MFINLVEQLLWYFASLVQFLELLKAVAVHNFLAGGSFDSSFRQRRLEFIVIFIIIWVHVQSLGPLFEQAACLGLVRAPVDYLISSDAYLVIPLIGLVLVRLDIRLWNAASFIKYSIINIATSSSPFTFGPLRLNIKVIGRILIGINGVTAVRLILDWLLVMLPHSEALDVPAMHPAARLTIGNGSRLCILQHCADVASGWLQLDAFERAAAKGCLLEASLLARLGLEVRGDGRFA